jgi:hypothetical protein
MGLTIGALFTQGAVVPAAGRTTDTFAAFQACDTSFENDSTACQMDPECDSQAVHDYSNCLGDIREAPDFCVIARQRANQCQYTYDPMTEFAEYSACTTASGVQYCE